jgi:uncharacterized protein (DUF39 family)
MLSQQDLFTMCSSGALLTSATQNGYQGLKVLFNNVPAYGGIAAVDAYIGATEVAEEIH